MGFALNSRKERRGHGDTEDAEKDIYKMYFVGSAKKRKGFRSKIIDAPLK